MREGNEHVGKVQDVHGCRHEDEDEDENDADAAADDGNDCDQSMVVLLIMCSQSCPQLFLRRPLLRNGDGCI